MQLRVNVFYITQGNRSPEKLFVEGSRERRVELMPVEQSYAEDPTRKVEVW